MTPHPGSSTSLPAPMADWLHDIPRWLSAVALLATFVGIAIVGLASTRGWMRRRGVHALIDNNVVGWMFSAMLAIYAITIGLTAVASWSNAVGAANVASLEAAEIAAVYRDVDGYPEPVRSELQNRLRGYLEDVIDAAWHQNTRIAVFSMSAFNIGCRPSRVVRSTRRASSFSRKSASAAI